MSRNVPPLSEIVHVPFCAMSQSLTQIEDAGFAVSFGRWKQSRSFRHFNETVIRVSTSSHSFRAPRAIGSSRRVTPRRRPDAAGYEFKLQSSNPHIVLAELTFQYQHNARQLHKPSLIDQLVRLFLYSPLLSLSLFFSLSLSRSLVRYPAFSHTRRRTDIRATVRSK